MRSARPKESEEFCRGQATACGVHMGAVTRDFVVHGGATETVAGSGGRASWWKPERERGAGTHGACCPSAALAFAYETIGCVSMDFVFFKFLKNFKNCS